MKALGIRRNERGSEGGIDNRARLGSPCALSPYPPLPSLGEGGAEDPCPLGARHHSPGHRPGSGFLVACLLALTLLSSPVLAQEAQVSEETHEVLFVDVTESAGITFEHQSAPEKKYILESMSGGVALFDADRDGRLDIYFVNSLTVDTVDDPASAPSALYRNLGPGPDGFPRFEDIAAVAGVATPGWGMGLCVADLEGDGDRDLYITSVGDNRLYRNDGPRDGAPVHFTDVAPQAGVTAGGWSAGCGFADYDRDGDLDLFVSRYVEIDMANLPEFGKEKTCQYRGVAVQCGPRGLPGTSDLLFRNEGPGEDGIPRFVEVSKAVGVDDPDGYFGLGIAWFDADADGWLDLFVANDSTPNFFYRNLGPGDDGVVTFEELAFPMGVAVSEDGAEQGGMGVAVGDFRNDGKPGLFVSNFAEEYNTLYRNETMFLSDVSFRSGTAASSLPYVGWGTAFLDYDNDGWLDLIVVNGHVYPQLDNAKLGASAPYRQRRLLYRGLGLGSNGQATFEEVAERFGLALSELRVSRGLATGDLDGDGRIDVVINDLDGAPQVLINRHSETGNWLAVDVQGRSPVTDALGAVVTVRIGESRQSRVIRSGTSYLSQNAFRQHFGLGSATRVDAVEVLWPDGTTTTLEGVEAGQVVEISQPAPQPDS